MPETLESKQIYRGRVVGLRLDRVQLDDGREVRQEVVEHAPSVGVIPMWDAETVILIRQYRHSTGEVLLEIPAGSFDPGEEAEACAQRELAEEIGYQAGEILAIGGFYLAPGWATEYMHIFLARDLQPAEAERDEDEEIFLERMSLAELEQHVSAGRVRDAKTLAALYLARGHLRSNA
jgi:8-oxo-dGTP pyrophosphatase MutT (NUDIX family)